MPKGIYTRKTTRKGWIRKLDKLVGDIVKLRDGKCVVCGTTESLTSGHLLSRGHYSTRWDLDNCFAQCSSCNLKHEEDTWPFTRYYLTIYSQDHLDELHRRWSSPSHFKNHDLEELYNQLEVLINGQKIIAT